MSAFSVHLFVQGDCAYEELNLNHCDLVMSYIWVNTGSVNDNTKPLPESMLTSH